MLAEVEVTIVGPGRVGASFANWLRAAGARVVAVGRDGVHGLDSSASAALLVTVPDGALAEVAALLASRRQAPVALHAAGARDASALAALRAGGTAVGSLHPLCAFAAVRDAPPPGLVFGIDGDRAAVAMARRLAGACRGTAVEIPEAARPLYHFGATLAAGGSTALLGLAIELAADLGLPPAIGAGYRDLAAGAIAALDPRDPAHAITGPVARGDVDLVERQLGAVGARRPELAAAARAVAVAALALLERCQGLDAAQRRLRARLELDRP
jgi:predicted short-subunit dehydrogenase-like oxidoreductase (DUF2520 family)